MPCYLAIDGKKQEMGEDIFDQMVEAFQNQSKKPQTKPPRDGNLTEPMTANH